MITELFPRIADGVAEFAWLVFWALWFLFPTFFDKRPYRVFPIEAFEVRWSVVWDSSGSGISPRFWLWHFMLANQMLNEIILAVADVGAVDDITDPSFQLSMSLIFMPNPIGFPLERFGVRT